MKGGFRNNLLMVRPLSLTLAGFVAATLLVWVSEKNPFLPLSQQRFTTVSTENDAETTYVLSNATYENDNTEDKGLDLVTTEETNSEVEHSGIWPLDSPPTFSSEEQANQTNVASSSGSEGALWLFYHRKSGIKLCNYAKGRWVADNSRPLYSGLQCKQWLSTMWACRQTQRPDFSYEGYRWQPQHCEMPNFERSSLLKRMQNKTVAFIGDSLGRQQFQSLMCMATGGEYSEEVLDVGKEYNLVKPSGAVRPHGWAYRFPQTNTTIIFYWSASLSYLVPFNASDPDSQVAMHLDRPPAFLRNYIHRFTTLVLNTGHHWNRGKLSQNRWVMHVNGKLVEQGSELMKIGKAKSFNINSIVKWVDSQLPSHPELKAFFRTISPRHFSHGEWDSGGSCDNVVPLSGGSEVVRDESSDPLVEGALRGTNVKILDITALSKLRDEAHISRYRNGGALGGSDCLHWCLPGIPDSWNELLIAQL